MSDRKAQAHYFPPDWDPSKGGLNKYHGQHHLRERARKLDQGILIIRFELPYNIWCGGCERHLGVGVRFNAEKKKVGNYYSTPIMHFAMKCPSCSNRIEMQTDPKNSDYVVVAGGRRQDLEFTADDVETVPLKGGEEAELLAQDPMYRLEHGVADTSKAQKSAPGLVQLARLTESHKDTYESNKALRAAFRAGRNERRADRRAGETLADKYALAVPMLPESSADRAVAKALASGDAQRTQSESKRQHTRSEVLGQSVFTSTRAPLSGVKALEKRLRQCGDSSLSSGRIDKKQKKEKVTMGSSTRSLRALVSSAVVKRRRTATEEQSKSTVLGLVSYESDEEM